MTLGDRMKEYESASKFKLTKKVPVILRLDGKAFHTFTRGLQPFDYNITSSMLIGACAVMKEIQGAKLLYQQSDEVSILITDYDKPETEAWFDYNISKMNSVAASVMTAHFNRDYQGSLAYFDCRCFNIPREDVVNYFLWRAKDWERNSLSMYCRKFFSAKQLHKKNRAEQHEMLHSINKNWTTDLCEQDRNGTFIITNVAGQKYCKPNYVDIFSFISGIDNVL